MLQIFGCVLVWLLVGLFLGNICQTVREGVAYVRRLHQIPCSRCAFFTGDYRLKCTVHPFTALSESAIGCRDFESTSSADTKLIVQPDCSKCTGNSFPSIGDKVEVFSTDYPGTKEEENV